MKYLLWIDVSIFLLGVGGMVINDKNQVLTIQEKYHLTPHWKLPGGYSNPGNCFQEKKLHFSFYFALITFAENWTW